ncbi:MAG: hypothetical protein K8U03_15025 [Planctomycetia bacterium]|nr:hypothetical protein [Planctomycetia bacterium]
MRIALRSVSFVPAVGFRAGMLLAVVACTGVALAADQKPADPKAPDAKGPKITYDEHVQQIFREHCYTCHNQNESKSDLALDSYTRTMAGGAGGECVIPGDLESSRLYALVAHIESPKMPPAQDKIAEAKLTLIKQWILGGALENAGSKAKIKPKVELKAATTAGNKPNGPAAMPEKFRRQPFVVATRPGSSTGIAASPWAPLIAVAGQKQIMLHNSDTGALLTILAYPEGIPHILKFSRDGSVLLAGGGRGGSSGKVVLFKVKTGERITEVGDELDVVLAADVSSDLSLVALGGPKKMVRVFSVADGTLQYEMKKHTDWIYAVEFSPDGVLLASSDRSAGLMIWESDGGREYQNLTGHTAGITDPSWRADSNILASVSEDGSLRLWEMENGKQVKTWVANNGGSLAVEFAPNGQIVTAGRDKTCKVWDLDGKLLATSEAMPEMVMDAVLSYDGKRIIAGDWAGNGRFFDAVTGKPAGNLLLNPLPLEQRVSYTAQLASEAEKLAVAAKTSAENAGKNAEAAAAGVAKANASANEAVAEVKRLEALRPELDRQTPVKQAAVNTAQQKVTALRRQQADVKGAEAKAVAQAKQKADASTAAADAVKKIEAEVAKLTAEKKEKEIPPAAKRLDAAKADAAAKTAQTTEAAKALTDAQAKAKKHGEDLAVAEKAIVDLNADFEAHRKAIGTAATTLNALKPQIKPRQDAIAPAIKAKEAADKYYAEQQALAKTADDAAKAAKQIAEQAVADKAEYDKAANPQQANAAK